MLVTVIDKDGKLDGTYNTSRKLLYKSDLVLQRTDEEDWQNGQLYRIVKNRFAREGQLVPERKIDELVEDYERRLEDVKSR